MKQKDDRNYTFVVSRSNRSLIRVRRYEISKRLVHACAGIAIFSIGAFAPFLSRVLELNSQTAYAHNQSSAVRGFFPVNKEMQRYGEGGPDITEAPAASQFDVRIRNLEKSFRDSEHTPSIYPVVGKINDDFGTRDNPFGGSSSEFHAGLDIDGNKGDLVVAPAKGIVSKASYQGGYGNLIEIDHGNGLTTRYGHLSEIGVEIGQEVARGQEIGKVGSTGRSTGPHLHYEVRIDGEAVNPRSYLPVDASPVVQPQ
jgi:murein DD-endopeptidase MepM/ murein hydrolase activator NlpD